MATSFDTKRLEQCRKLIAKTTVLDRLYTLAEIKKVAGEELTEDLHPFIVSALAALWKHHPNSFLHSMSMTRRAVVLVVITGLRQTTWGKALVVAALVHDLGKIGVPVSILAAERKLTESDIKIMNQHPGLMFELIGRIVPLAARMAIQHHEHGHGRHRMYPRGRSESLTTEEYYMNLRSEIPWKERDFGIVLSIIDVVDALHELRNYRHGKPVSNRQILKLIRKTFGSGYVEIARLVLNHKPPHSILS